VLNRLKKLWRDERTDYALLGVGIAFIVATLVFAPIMDMDTVFQVMSNIITRMHDAVVNTLGKIQG